MKYREGYCSEEIRNEAYAEILDNLSGMRKVVYNAIKELEPCTNEEVARHLGKYPHETIARINELRKIGLVIFAGKKKSERSGRSASLWRRAKVNPQLRIPFDNK